MNRTLILAAFVSLSMGGLAACNGSDLETLGGSQPTDPSVDPNDPHNGGQNAPDPTPVPSSGDQDGDGIPDGTDNIPCRAFWIKVWNQNVSSAEVAIDDVTVIPSSDFPTDQVLTVFINPHNGTNTLSLGGKLTGSPDDELHIEIWDDTGVLYLHQTMVRDGGTPQTLSVTFDVNVQC